ALMARFLRYLLFPARQGRTYREQYGRVRAAMPPENRILPALPNRERWCKGISTFPWTNGHRSGLPANVLYPLLGVALAAALCGCTSTDGVTPTPSFT